MKCQGMCKATRNGKGAEVMRCTSCGFMFNLRPM